MPRGARWNITESSPLADELAGALRTSPLIAQVLINRGMGTAAECQQFLFPALNDLHQPALLPNLAAAAERVARAIRDHEKIVIYGDYDVDGITATSILWHAIRLLGGQADYYIPHRIEEGYGMNPQAVAAICDDGARVIISVDCGITAVAEAAIARQRGVDLIVTDHHEWHEEAGQPALPECHAIVHPRLPGAAAYPNPHLCGAGVAFKLAWGIGQAVRGAARVDADFRAFLVEATALAALGTIADVVPLKGENRILARFGLGGLKQSKLTGIRALIASAGLTGQTLDSYHVGFLLAPRLNACGRMGHAREAVEMLTRADETRAIEIATYLEQQNRARQALEKQIFEQALRQCDQVGYRQDDDECRGIVLGAEGWHPGVIGIVASRVVNRFNRPTIMVALNNGHGQGSGRSIAGFHLARALEACREHLEGCGGHEMAAGLSLQSAKFGDFREAFCCFARQAVTVEMLRPELSIDAVAAVSQISPALVKDLDRMGPFGQGNPKPLLCLKDVELAAPPRRMGRTGEHLTLIVRQGGSGVRCIAFGAADRYANLPAGTRLDLAIEPTLNTYRGMTSVEAEVMDVKAR